MLINISRVGVKRMGPDSFQWCPVTGQRAVGTNWSTGSSSWTGGRTCSLWVWRSTGTCCPEGLWILLLWRYINCAWTRSCAVCCRWSCFGRGIGLDDPQRSLPTPNLLWFCGCFPDLLELWWCPLAEVFQCDSSLSSCWRNACQLTRHVDSHLKRKRAQKNPRPFSLSLCSFTFVHRINTALPVKGVCVEKELSSQERWQVLQS